MLGGKKSSRIQAKFYIFSPFFVVMMWIDKWIKVKPDYIEVCISYVHLFLLISADPFSSPHCLLQGVRDNLDLLLLGAYYGEGSRRAGGISHFLLGVLEKKITNPSVYDDRRLSPPNVLSFCKVGSGYSLEQLKELRQSWLQLAALCAID